MYFFQMTKDKRNTIPNLINNVPFINNTDMNENKVYELEGFIMMPVHVPSEEVKDRHVHEVE